VARPSQLQNTGAPFCSKLRRGRRKCFKDMLIDTEQLSPRGQGRGSPLSPTGDGSPSRRNKSISRSRSKSGKDSPQHHKAVLNTSYIARPSGEGTSLANMTSKRNRGSAHSTRDFDSMDSDAGLQKLPPIGTKTATIGMKPVAGSKEPPKMRSLRTPHEKTTIAEKEDILEQIMCAEAYAGFEQMARYQLNISQVSRVGLDMDRLSLSDLQMEHLHKLVDGSDLGEDLPQLLEQVPPSVGDFIEKHSTSHAESHLPESLCYGHGLRIGSGFSDNYEGELVQEQHFVARCGQYTLLGVVNGHGKKRISEQLVERMAELMPDAVFKSHALAYGDPAAALSEAFHRVHQITSMELDLHLTGASCTVVLADDEVFWVANVGDCRAVLGTPDPKPNAEHFHFVPVPLTEDHVLSVKTEFDRIQASGGEMRRLVNDKVYRLYLQDGDVPGLTLTRSIGDRVAHVVGISHLPTIGAVRRQDLAPGSFVLIGSGAVWSLMSERVAVNWVGRYFSEADQAARALSNSAFSRMGDMHRDLKSSNWEEDCFGVMLLFVDEPVEAPLQVSVQTPTAPATPVASVRPFALGPKEGDQRTLSDWKEVKSADRSMKLRKLQSNGRFLLDETFGDC